jgi:hypothetical protein
MTPSRAQDLLNLLRALSKLSFSLTITFAIFLSHLLTSLNYCSLNRNAEIVLLQYQKVNSKTNVAVSSLPGDAMTRLYAAGFHSPHF